MAGANPAVLAVVSRIDVCRLTSAADCDQPRRSRPAGGELRPQRTSVRRINAAQLGQGGKALGQSDHGLGGSENEIAVGGRNPAEPIEHIGLGRLVEIDQHVAAKDQIEHAERGEIRQQVELPELDHRAQFRRDLPHVSRLAEIFDQERDRQSALYLELAVDPGLRLAQNAAGKIGGNDLDTPAGQRVFKFLDRHGERIRLLPRRCGCRPDANVARCPPCGEQRRQDRGAEILEWRLVAEEKRLIGGHGLDHCHHQGFVAATQRRDKAAQAHQTGLACDRQQAAFDQILLVGR